VCHKSIIMSTAQNADGRNIGVYEIWTDRSYYKIKEHIMTEFNEHCITV